MNYATKVQEFHRLFEQPVISIQEVETKETRQLRIKLLFEELSELAEASDVVATFNSLCRRTIGNHPPILVDGDKVNYVEELDALCDIQYVLAGKLLTSGLHEVFDEAFDIVHSNNMTKAHKSKEHIQITTDRTHVRLTAVERDGKWLAFNSDNKLTKPWDHKKVGLAHLLPAHKQNG